MPISFNLDTHYDNYCVMGNPIAHSLSPQIHSTFARQTAQTLLYYAMLVEPGEFAGALEQFYKAGGKGLNVTIPFKQEAWALAHKRSQRAELAGAVNTLWFGEDGRYYGDNTDGIGFIKDYLSNHGGCIKGCRILILGAGGAVRGVLGPILAERPDQLVLANRTIARANEIKELLADYRNIEVCCYNNALVGRHFDLIINGTAASLQGCVPPLPENILAESGCCYDMMYAEEATPFVQWGLSHGAAKSVDGLGMLVEQAAESFFLWRGVRPETAPVIELLRGNMHSSRTRYAVGKGV